MCTCIGGDDWLKVMVQVLVRDGSVMVIVAIVRNGYGSGFGGEDKPKVVVVVVST